MTTIDNLMALHDEAAGWKAKHYWQDDRGTSESVIADYEKRMKQSREALRTALTEALAAQPVREFDGSDEFYEYWSRVPNFTQSQAWEAYTSNQPVREPDLSALSPKVQARIREWLADGTFVERAIGTMREQERELMKHGIGGDK